MITFSVIIPTYKRPIVLARCLNGVLGQVFPTDRYEIIVVDNDSSGSASDIVRKVDHIGRKVRYEKRSNNNVSEARNLGSKLAQGEWLAFLDDDCIPDIYWLSKAEEVNKKYPEYGLVFGGGYKTTQDSFSSKSESEKILASNIYLVEGNCFFRKNEYLKLGGMRSDLGPSDKRFGYHEGSELQDRHHKHYGSESRRVFASELAVVHLPTPKPALWFAIVSGYDSIFAFRKKQPTNIGWNYFRLGFSMIRLCKHSISGSREGRDRELYRIGELSAEILVLLTTKYRALSSFARRLNNKKIGLGTKTKLVRNTACAEDYAARIRQGIPFVAGKIGGAELMALEYMDHRIRVDWPKRWSWRRPAIRLSNNAGFFPIEKIVFQRWHKIMLEAIRSVDFLCVWQNDPFLEIYENMVMQELSPDSRSIPDTMLGRGILPDIATFRFLIISPFVRTMQKQLSRLKQVNDPDGKLKINWNHIEKTCQFIRCPFQRHLEPSPYASWEDGLEKLTKEVSLKDFDLALIGAGAWSLPLAMHIKRMGKCAIHMGGEMQLLFGIKGKRWENSNIYNSAWTRPDPEDTPINANSIEDGCYW